MKSLLLCFVAATLQAGSLQEEWDVFSSKYPTLEKFSISEVVALANAWGKKMDPAVREIDLAAVQNVTHLLQEGHPKVFMRHGEQQKSEAVQKLTPAEQKIAMMRLPENFENGVTKTSNAEWLESMIVWKYITEKTGKTFKLESSKNRRAEIPASALATALKSELTLNDALNCVNYPSDDKMTTQQILAKLPDGTLPWEKEKVDAIVGAGTYDRITGDMSKLLTTTAPYFAITHTQQINAIATLSQLPATRLGNYGFILVTDQHKEVFPEGIYKKKGS